MRMVEKFLLNNEKEVVLSMSKEYYTPLLAIINEVVISKLKLLDFIA